ncbi:hypothetical protein LTS17_007300 [Exophiala oligosperma]
MNCPSRTDNVKLEHPDWNQNPPDLAADLTTCQDLNGITNSREYKGADDHDGIGSLSPTVEVGLLDRPPDTLAPVACEARLPCGVISPLKTVTIVDGRNRLASPLDTPAPTASALWSWTTWGLSVAITSFAFSAIGQTYEVHQGCFGNGPASAHLTKSPGVKTSSVRKRSTCSDDRADQDLYNTPLHVGALFIILFVSTLACSFAMLASNFPGLRLPARFFFVVRHFGTGVLIATAFVHLLPTAFISLGDSCLSSFWSTDYPAMPGAIALAGIFLVILVEMIFHPCRQVQPRRYSVSGNDTAFTKDAHVIFSRTYPTGPLRDMGPLVGNTSSISRNLSRVHGAHDVDEISHVNPSKARARSTSRFGDNDAHSLSMDTMARDVKLRKARLQCVLLEIGILFHSVFIGMALSVSTGKEFVVLLIAIAFHQTFEGLALGSRIANIDWPMGTWQPWFMALTYGCTTPIGQAIGLATHSLYSPTSETGLLLVGTMNALSAGLLTFASLVELLSEDFLSDNSWDVLRGKNRIFACVLVFSGAFAMSVVGAWA